MRFLQEWKVVFKKYHPILWEAYSSAVGAEGDLDLEIWKRLPTTTPELRTWAEVGARFCRVSKISPLGKTYGEGFNSIRYLSLRKLAMKLTAQNPWQMSSESWKLSQEIQQLWPLWKAGLLREFGMSFNNKPSPKEIARSMTLISENILDKRKISSFRVISRHQKRKSSEITEWHVHGYVWPREGEQITKVNFRTRLSRLRKDFKEKRKKGLRYNLKSLWMRDVGLKSLARSASYIAGNLDKTKKLRAEILHKPKEYSLLSFENDIKWVRLVGHSETIGLDKKGKPIPWESWRKAGRTTPFANAYRKSASKAAGEEGENIPLTKGQRWKIFREAPEYIEDPPRIPTVRGEDGFIYEVHPGKAIWWETQFFYLVRLEEKDDYRLLGKKVPMKKRKVSFEKIMIHISLHDLFRLGQAEVAHYCKKANFRPVCPQTGRSPTPICEMINFPDAVLKGKRIDSIREEKWIRGIKNRMDKARSTILANEGKDHVDSRGK